MRNADFARLERTAGIYFLPETIDFVKPEFAMDFALACDAQPSLITTSNAGIPAFLTLYQDPKLIEVLLSPMKAAQIVGDEQRKGDWLSETAMFTVIESTGEVSSYGDFSENGSTGVNFQFPQRQAYGYQTVTEYGEKQIERAGLAKIDFVGRLNIASALTLNKFQNATYFFGVDGLQNYGLLNDPSLSAFLTPATKTYGGVKWINNGVIVATANEIYSDIQSMFVQLQVQSKGAIDLESKVVLAMSSATAVALTATNSFNVNVTDLLKKNFPNIRFETAQEYAQAAGTPTAAGNLVQMFVEEVQGQQSATTAFTEKMRAHPVVTALSSFKQKKSQGSWGTVIFSPFAFTGMIGV